MPARHKPNPIPAPHHAHHESTLSLDGLSTPAFHQAQAHTLSLPPRTTATLNLSVLQRYNPEIEHILAVAPFAAVYDFGPSGAWEKTGVEGTLFVVQLTSPYHHDDAALEHASGIPIPPATRFAVVVLNRKGLDNFSAPLSGADGVERADDFVMVTAPAAEAHSPPAIHGLWVFGDGSAGASDAREVVARVMAECAESAGQSAHEAELQRAIAERRRAEYAMQGGQGFAERGQHVMGFAPGSGYQMDGAGGYESGPAPGGDVLGSLFARARAGMGGPQL